MVFGARGPCGQRVRLVVVQGLGRGSDRVTAPLRKMAGNRAAAPRDKWEIAVTGRAQVNTCKL